MINIQQLKFDYKEMPMTFDLTVKTGEKIAIVGASGAGKAPC